MTDAAQHNKSINASPTRAMLDDLLGTRIAVQRDEMPQEGVKSAGNSAGYIAKAKTDLYMVKPVLKQGEIDKLNSDNAYKAYMQFLTYFNDFPLTQSSIINLMQAHLNPLASEHEQNRNIKSLESALNATLKAEKFSAEQKDLDPHQVLLLVLQNIDSHKEALQISNITSAKDTIFLKYDKEQMIHELAFGRAFNILLPGKASDVALVYTGNEVQKVNGMNVATIRPDKGSLDVGTRSKFLGPEFYTLHELQQKENGIAIWKDVRGFSDVVAASYMLGDYDIHSGNIGVIRRENVPKLDSTGKYSVNKDGEIIHQSNTNFATMNKEPVLESYWQAVKIDHGFAGTNIKAGAETHLSQDYINMSAAPSFAELKNDIIAHLNYGLPLDDKGKIDLHGKQSVLNVNLTPEQFKQSIDTMLQHKPEELIDSVGQRLYAAAQIGLMSREEADKKYKELAQSISDRYHGM